MINLVRVALRRPYTMAVAALLIMLMGAISVTRMIVDIFPNIDIPVVYVAWSYNGLNAEDMERRVVLVCGARLLHDGQRHRAHRIAVDPGPGHPQDLFPAGRGHRRRDRADLGAEQRGAAHRAARHAAAEHHPVQRVERAGGAGHAEQQDARRAACCRTTPTTSCGCGCSPSPALSIPGAFGGKQRQIIVEVDTGEGELQGPVADGRGQCAWARPTSSCRPASRGIGPNEYNIQLNSSPKIVDQFNYPAGRRARRHSGSARRRRQGQRQLRAADQHRAHQRAARELPADPEEQHRVDAGGRRRRQGHAAGASGDRAGGHGTGDGLRPVGVRARRRSRTSSRRRSSPRSSSR